MAQIFVNTDNSNVTNKIYKAGKVGKSAAAAEGKMKGAVVEIVGKAADFTTTKFGDAKGYTIRIEVSKVEKAGAQTTYTLSGEIVRYPATVTKSHGKGEEMVTLRPMTPSFKVEGASESLILETIESVVEDMVTKMLPAMRIDMTRR
jgi:hypothetical protein